MSDKLIVFQAAVLLWLYASSGFSINRTREFVASAQGLVGLDCSNLIPRSIYICTELMHFETDCTADVLKH
jgi:hypothetical protein